MDTSPIVLTTEQQVPVRTQNPNPPRFALSLGSGGVRGLFHIGVFEVLYEAGLIPDLMVGCSSGAIVGALIADDPRPAEVKRKAFELISYASGFQMASCKWLGMPSWRGLWGFGFFNMKRILPLLESLINARTFEQLQLPLCVIAANLNTGLLTEFDSGPLLLPLLASSAVPGLFQPIEINGDLYADGHVIEGIPISSAQKRNAKCIVAVNIFNRVKPLLRHRFNVMRRAFLVANEHRATEELKRAHLVIEGDIPAENFLFLRPATAEEIYDEGRKCAEAMLPQLRERLAELQEQSTDRHSFA